jgi:hypothetical protein
MDDGAGRCRFWPKKEATVADDLVRALYQSWVDLDDAIAGLTDEQATERRDGQSAIAWTVGHVGQQIDSWLNMRLQGLPRNRLLADRCFATGEEGRFDDWPGLLAAVGEARERARRFLDREPAPELELRVPYDGAIVSLRATGLTLRYALVSIAAHHWIHAGEIGTLRSQRRHATPAIERGGWGRAFL